eukprot:2161081-Karenia_brevis.AAC.1
MFGMMGRSGREARRRSVPDSSHIAFGAGHEDIRGQRELVGMAEKRRRDAMLAGAGIWDRARMEATAAPHAGAWMDAPPSLAFNTRLTNSEV